MAGSSRIRASVRLALIGAFVVACRGPGVSPGTSPTPGSSAISAPTGRLASVTPGPATPVPTTAPETEPAATPGSATPGAVDVRLGVEPFLDGLDALTFLTHAGDGSGDLYAVAQRGLIYRVDVEGALQTEPFLDIDERMTSGGEQGLLGLAFHPDYESNGRLFVHYTDNRGDTVISEYTRGVVDRGASFADADSERVLLQVDQPYPNHNGGMIAFGSDGYLYIGLGDGGSGGDPLGNGQAMSTLLGKILRIDVDSGDPFGIPADNPFVDQDLARPEIWSLGLRNPWRFSFDSESGAMFIGDVGQGSQEEIDAEPAGAGGRNYGWNVVEGAYCFATDPCDTEGLTPPVVGIDHTGTGACAITGGYVYRGAAFPELVGTYVFSDFCAGTLWTFDAQAALDTGQAVPQIVGESGLGPSSFGEDEAGELYVVTLEGEIFRVVQTG
jgi:glucose/arabinose dehydrogenase